MQIIRTNCAFNVIQTLSLQQHITNYFQMVDRQVFSTLCDKTKCDKMFSGDWENLRSRHPVVFFPFRCYANMTEEEAYYCQENVSKIQEMFTSVMEQLKEEVQKFMVISLIKCTLFVMCSTTDHLLQNQSQLFKTLRPASEHKSNGFFLGTKQFVLLMCILDLGPGIWKALLFWGSHSMPCLPVIVGIWKMTTLVCAEERQTLLKLSFMVPADGLSPLYFV